MPPLASFARTGAFAWGTSPAHLPILATGTASGALDDSFDQGGRLELWAVFPDSSLPAPPSLADASTSAAKQSPTKSKHSRKESLPGQDIDFGADEDGDDFLSEVNRPGQGDDNKREPVRSFKVSSRFSRLAWSAPFTGRPRGVLAAGMENGELVIYDPAKLLSGASLEEATIFQQIKHKGPVRALDFSSGKKQLLASGSSDGEILIWDTTTLTSASTAYSPGPTSKPGDVTSLAWNVEKEFILASALSTGHTIIWDLRTKTQIKTLTYTAPGLGGGGPGGNSGRGAISSVCWHPDNPTSIITASEDDASPVIMLWNLRNALAPEAILSGHDKGILSLSWCKQDPNLLLSSGKDNRNILWNPNSREMLGEYPASNNWIFQTGFCPRNPDIFASASFDGKINVFSLQTNRNFSECSSRSAHQQASESEDLFDNPSFLASSTEGDFSLQQPPKWLQRPVSATFGFGGLLTTTSNLSGASGKTQSATVHLRTVVTEPELMDRVRKLQSAAGSKEDLGVLCEERSRDAEGAGGEQDVAAWRALSSLFTANSRSELVSLLGFSKEEVSEKVAVAINKFKKDHGKDDLPKEAIEPPSTTVTFAEDTTSGDFSVDASSKEDSTASTASGGAGEVAGSEFSTGGLSDATKKTEAESEATEPSSSLFSDDDVGTPQTDAAPDFFSSMGTLRSALPSHVLVPHQPQQAESSAAATVGSAPSLAASEMLKVSTFKIYPSDESEVDNLITRALVLGDFQSAVSLCLSSERFADAILLAVRGGPELLAKTQKTYFERRTESLPYLRLFQSIVSDDLADVVQNADLTEWQEIFVVLCTFAKADEFNNLAEQLGQRLEHQYRVAAGSEDSNVARQAKDHRRNATLCFLAAKKLERIVTIWADEMREEEESLQAASSASSRYTAHAKALQSFIEKVSVFQGATDYIDNDFASPTESEAIAESGARSYKLSTLYERYFEYADLLATQGLVQAAAKYVQLTPADFRLEGTSADPNAARERFLAGASVSAPATTTTPNTSASAYAKPAPVATLFAQAPAQRQPPPVSTSFKPSHGSRASASGRNARASISINGNSPFIAVAAPTPPVVTPGGPSPAQSVYSPYPAASSAPYQISSPHGVAPQTGGYNNYGTQSNYGAQQSFGAPSSAGIPPPPRPVGTPGSQTPPPLLPAAARRDIPGWNDAPPSKASAILRPFSAANKAGPITSPFPNSPGMAPPPMSPGVTGPAHQQQNNGFFPPPRGSTPQAAPPPPPPSRGASQVRPLPPPIAAPSAPPPRAAPPPAARPAPPPGARAPPRVTSPLSVAAPQAAVSARSPPPSAGPYAPPPGSQPSAAPLTGHGAPAPPPAKAQASPAPPAPPAAPKYPPGDRSHIPTANIPIFEQIQFLFEHVRSLPPPNPQAAQELQRMPAKLDLLYDRLNSNNISEDLASKLREIAKSMENRRLDEAYPFLLSFIPNTAFDGLLPAITSLKLLMSIAMSPPQ